MCQMNNSALTGVEVQPYLQPVMLEQLLEQQT